MEEANEEGSGDRNGDDNNGGNCDSSYPGCLVFRDIYQTWIVMIFHTIMLEFYLPDLHGLDGNDNDGIGCVDGSADGVAEGEDEDEDSNEEENDEREEGAN